MTRATLIAGTFVAAFAVWTGFDLPGTTWVNDLATFAVALAGTVLCMHAARGAEGPTRRFWGLLGIALALWTAGEAAWMSYELFLGQAVPAPSVADIGYLGAIPFAAAALAFHPASHRQGTRTARYAFDALLIATALFFVSWSLILAPLGKDGSPESLGGVVAMAYPFGDVILLFFAILALRGMPRGTRAPVWWIVGGLIAMAVADGAYAWVGVQGYETGSLIDAGWVAGYAAIGLGAYAAQRSFAPAPARLAPPTLAVLAAPFVIVLVALTLAAVQIQTGGEELDTVGLSSLWALVVLALARQAVLVREYVIARRGRAVSVAQRLVEAATGRSYARRNHGWS